jgi:hypothetical protein
VANKALLVVFKSKIGELGERVVYLGRKEDEDGLGEEMKGDSKKGGRTGKSRVEIDQEDHTFHVPGERDGERHHEF